MYTVKIKRIKYIGIRKTADLRVPDLHNYILPNGVITHNSGKSTFVQAIAHYIDPTLTLDRVVFSAEDLMKAIDNSKKRQAIIFDEAVLNMSSQDFASQLQQILIKKFTLIRSRNLYIFLVIPSFFMLRKYFAMFRTRFLIHCYTPDGVKRGYFQFYSYVRKKKLYLYGMKEWNMSVVPCNFRGRFTNTFGFFVNPIDYEKKKQEAVAKLTEEKNTPLDKMKEEYSDYKLKLKIDVDKYKGKWKEKFAEQKALYNTKLSAEKKKFDKELKEIERESITLQKNRDNDERIKLYRAYSKLLYGYFIMEKKRFESLNKGHEFTLIMFHDMLQKEKLISLTMFEITKHIEEGGQFIKLDSYK